MFDFRPNDFHEYVIKWLLHKIKKALLPGSLPVDSVEVLCLSHRVAQALFLHLRQHDHGGEGVFIYLWGKR